MAGGQGFKGNVGTGEGVYISVVMDAEDAIIKTQQLDGEVDNLTTSMTELEGATERTRTAGKEFSSSFDDAADSLEDVDMANLKAMAGMTMMVSALNQVTGGVYKTVGGLEAWGFVNEEQAKSLQDHARKLEALTGPLEIIISLEILATMMGKPFLATLWAKVPAFTGVGAAATTAATGVWAFMAPLLPFVVLGLIVVGVIFLIMSNLEGLAKILGVVTDGFKTLAGWIQEVFGFTTGLTSSLTALGDAFTDNPVTKLLSKAGGAIF